MTDHFKRTRHHDWAAYDPDFYGIGHTKQRTKYRKKQNRRVRRAMKQELQKGLF